MFMFDGNTEVYDKGTSVHADTTGSNLAIEDFSDLLNILLLSSCAFVNVY